jgi:hypothetical protein
MARKTKEELKSFFEPNDLPTDQDFSDLIDSCYNAISGYSGIIEFVDNNAVTNTVTISSGFIANWTQQ